jgi:hypothetical protein
MLSLSHVEQGKYNFRLRALFTFRNYVDVVTYECGHSGVNGEKSSDQ